MKTGAISLVSGSSVLGSVQSLFLVGMEMGNAQILNLLKKNGILEAKVWHLWALEIGWDDTEWVSLMTKQISQLLRWQVVMAVP